MSNYDEAREAIRRLEAELGVTLSLGYIGNCSPTYDADRPEGRFNYDDRSWSVDVTSIAVPYRLTEGRGPWSHRASGTSYPSTRSWVTADWPSVEALTTMI